MTPAWTDVQTRTTLNRRQQSTNIPADSAGAAAIGLPENTGPENDVTKFE